MEIQKAFIDIDKGRLSYHTRPTTVARTGFGLPSEGRV